MLQGVGATGERARGLRQDMSLPEVLVWTALRTRPCGLKFRRQHPSGSYVADFYCHAARLIVEIDGSAHDFGDRPMRDGARDRWFAARDLAVVRITAVDIMQDVDAVVTGITNVAAERLRSGEI